MKATATWRATAVLACGALLHAQEPLVPRADLRGLERCATDLAKGGRSDEWRDLVAVLAQLGMPDKDLTTLRAAGDKDLARQKKPVEDASRLAKQLHDAALLLADRLPQVMVFDAGLIRAPAGEPATHFARQLLALDADVEAAHVVLGHVRLGSRWVVAEEPARETKRIAIQRALQDVRRLPVPLEMGESKGDEADAEKTGAALLTAVLGRPVTKVTVGKLTVHSARSAAQTRRIVEQTMRAMAFIHFALDGKLAITDAEPLRILLVDSRVVYDQCIVVACQRGWLDRAGEAEARQMSGFSIASGALILNGDTEAFAESQLLLWAEGRRRLCQDALTAGLLNWVCKAVLGTSVPLVSWVEMKQKAADAARTATQDGRAVAEREAFLRLAEAGLAGGRAYLRYLAARREDPPWSAGLLPELGQVQGKNLLKATFVVEFLVEEGRLLALDDGLRKAGTAGTLSELFAKALGETLPDFEDRWRTWLVGLPTGIVQRLQHKATGLPREVQVTLEALRALRARAFAADSTWVSEVVPVIFDEELSRGCQAHAAYLVAHPEHAVRWPDAHEENPDHADWSAEGAWAGGRSVIAPGSKNGEAALLAWMGTFYHRLPLLDPGLVRVGLGQSRDMVVLDSGSMVAIRNEDWRVAWPPEGMQGVPVRFVPELPNPVPGENQAQFGYPITLQLGARASQNELEVTMHLHEGSLADKEVPCWFSSPQQPTNPELAPANSFCLIPKASLRAGTRYFVRAELVREKIILTWSFKT